MSNSLLHKLPLVGRLLKQIDADTKAFSFQQAMLNTVNRFQTDLATHGLGKMTIEVLKNKPVVVVANHPHELEVLALIASLPPRKDTFLVISAQSLGVFPNLDKHLIPVYVEHHINEKYKQGFWDKLVKLTHHTPTFSAEEEHLKNRRSIAWASEKVKNGGLVIIFPSWRGINGKWFSGIGYLLKGINPKKPAFVVKIYIKGTTHFDYLRIIPGVSRILPKFEVFFSQPVKIDKFIKHYPKTITSMLEKEYNSWTTSLPT